MRVTKKNINIAIKEATGHDVEIVHGNGYWYFVYDGEDEATIKLIYGQMKSTSVFVYHLSAFSVNRWVEEFKALMNDT